MKKLRFIFFLLLGWSSIWGQTQVKGFVYDSITKEPLLAVSIWEINTTNGTFSDLDGSFELVVTHDTSKLEFSYIGYNSKVITYINQNMHVILVKIQYKQDTIQGSVDTLNKPKLPTNGGLQGKSAGIQVNADTGNPGSGMDIVIRGRGVRDISPLYIVDGVPVGYECPIDPDEIESISILKEKNPATIFPASRSNVIIIRTKQGNYKHRPEVYESIPQYQFGSESDFTKKIVKQLKFQGSQHNIKEQIQVLCSIDEKGKIHVLKTSIEKNYIFNQHLISVLENTVQWYPARQNGKDVETLNMFVFDFNEE